MPMYIKLRDGVAAWAEDAFTSVGDDEKLPRGDVIISLERFKNEGDHLLVEGRSLGVRLEAGEAVEDLVYDLPRLSLVALVFPKFKDGRNYTSARLLRDRYDFKREVRAVGEVLREQAGHMVRCGIDAFEPFDGSTPEQWQAAAHRYRHVYQRDSDSRVPAFVERAR